MGAAVGKKPTRLAKSEPYIKCAACKLAANEAWLQVAQKAAELPAGTLGELAIDEVLDGICDPDDNGGEWMTHIDVVQKEVSDILTLENKGELGECRRECNTIAHACRAVFDEHREDMTEMLYKNYRHSEKKLSGEKFVSRICTKLSKFCPGKKPPKGFQHRDENWMPIVDADGYKMRKMQHALNKHAKTGGGQPVQFLDPMGPGMLDAGDEDL
ncbi:unnamed protein product [Symbiodinium natans]|uniref:Saposin B-type domain-containing protein n=1 Tax=Symbiodinium natans TaxID=878477 RepID=A0A812QFN3_9DINO|nr:unnamed protein product [Symbiodinium natans]